MADNATLRSQYLAQVETDLERNTKEKERITADLAALQEQLTVLEQDRALLVGVRETLAGAASPAGADTAADAVAQAVRESGPAEATAEATPGAPAEAPVAVVPRARRAKAAARKAKAPAPKKARTVKATRTAKANKAADATDAAADAGAAAGAAGTEATATAPTLVELVTADLTGTGEPRSAAEIGTSLTQAHPDRRIRTTVVRNTLEGLVAKGVALRSRQGRSVYYSASGTASEGATESARATAPESAPAAESAAATA